MATQTHSRLATHIARGNVTLPNVPPIFIPAPQRPLQEPQEEEAEEEAEEAEEEQTLLPRLASDSAEILPKYSQEKEKEQTASSPNSNAII